MAEILTHPTVRAKVQADKCPKCGGELDTGWECNDCGFDAMPFLEKHCAPAPSLESVMAQVDAMVAALTAADADRGKS